MSRKNNKIKNAIDTDKVIYSMDPIDTDKVIYPMNSIRINNMIEIVGIDEIIKAMHLVAAIKSMYIDEIIKTMDINQLIKTLNIDKAQKIKHIVITKTIVQEAKVVDIDELIELLDIDELIKTIELDIDKFIKALNIDKAIKAEHIVKAIKTIYIYEAIKVVDIDKLTKKIDVDEVINALNIDEVIKVMDIIVKTTSYKKNRKIYDRISFQNYFGTINIKKGKFGPRKSTGYLLSMQVPKILGPGKTYIAVVVDIKNRFQMVPKLIIKEALINKSNIKIIDNDSGYSIYISKEIFCNTIIKNDNNTVIFYDEKQFIEGKIVIADIIGGGATGPATEDGLPPIDE